VQSELPICSSPSPESPCLCRNSSFGLVTKARVYKVASQEGSWELHNVLPKVWEGVRMNPHTPREFHFGDLESRWTLEFSEGDYKGQNSMAWENLYINGKLLKRRYLKWVRIAIWTSETQVMAKRRVRSQIGSLTPDH